MRTRRDRRIGSASRNGIDFDRGLLGALDLDAGYLSRLLKGLERRGFLTRKVAEGDARQSLLKLTGKGRREFEKLNARSDLEVGKLLAPLGASGRTALRIDCPEIRMCNPMRLLLASKAPTNLHCMTG